MFESINIAGTALYNQQQRLDVIADNLANSNTAGFKSSRYNFEDALYSAGGLGPTYTDGANIQKGRGVMMASVSRDFAGGSLITTEGTLDFAIEGDGFFEVVDRFGRSLYKRAGNFYASPTEGGVTHLVDSSGNFVQDSNGENVIIPEGTTSIEMAQDGTMSFIIAADDGETTGSAEGEEHPSVKLGIYTFSNKGGLSAAGGGNFEATDMSGGKVEAEGIAVVQGMLESSNVNMALEMTRMIRAQRALSLASRAVTTADDMEGIANNMRR